MQFTSNAAAFILSTVALLSLITPVICGYPITFTIPKTGQKKNAFDTLTITWVVDERQRNELDGISCKIDLQQIVTIDPSVNPSIITLVTDVAVMAGETGPVTIPGFLPSSDGYLMRCISADDETIFGEVVFTIL